VSWDLAVVDPLLVHPFPTESFLSRERIDGARRHPGVAAGWCLILSEAIRRADDRAYQGKSRAE
jgi:hypothetical protein